MRGPLSKISDQALLPVFFRTQFEDLLFPKEVHRESAGYAIGKILDRGAFEVFRVILEKQRMAGLVEFDKLPLKNRITGSPAVLQVIHLPFKQRILLKKLNDREWSMAHR